MARGNDCGMTQIYKITEKNASRPDIWHFQWQIPHSIVPDSGRSKIEPQTLQNSTLFTRTPRFSKLSINFDIVIFKAKMNECIEASIGGDW